VLHRVVRHTDNDASPLLWKSFGSGWKWLVFGLNPRAPL
jgi:hypothetical protein